MRNANIGEPKVHEVVEDDVMYTKSKQNSSRRVVTSNEQFANFVTSTRIHIQRVKPLLNVIGVERQQSSVNRFKCKKMESDQSESDLDDYDELSDNETVADFSSDDSDDW